MFKILEMLELADRKRCRLVCRTWYSILCSIFDNKERIFIEGTYSDRVNEITSILAKSTRSCFSFEFHGVDFFKGTPLNVFWEACGPRTTSIKLIDCKVSCRLFANILRCCCALQTLEVHCKEMEALRYGLGVQARLNKYEDAVYELGVHQSSSNEVIPASLQNHSLRTLRLSFIEYKPCGYVDDSLFWLDILCRLFHFFPNVSNFSFCHYI